MNVYSVLLLAAAVLFFAVAAAIHRGSIGLIHDYHRTRVRQEDQAAYAKAFSKGLFTLASTLLLSGAIALFGRDALWLSLSALLAGLATSVVLLLRAQRKFNGGLF